MNEHDSCVVFTFSEHLQFHFLTGGMLQSKGYI